MTEEYRIYDLEKKKYVTDDKLWFIASDGTLYYIKPENGGFVKAHNCKVEWSTGLVDEDRNKIFEGDILSGLFSFGMAINAVVTFRDGAFGVVVHQCGVDRFTAFTSFCNVKWNIVGNKWADVSSL